MIRDDRKRLVGAGEGQTEHAPFHLVSDAHSLQALSSCGAYSLLSIKARLNPMQRVASGLPFMSTPVSGQEQCKVVNCVIIE